MLWGLRAKGVLAKRSLNKGILLGRGQDFRASMFRYQVLHMYGCSAQDLYVN